MMQKVVGQVIANVSKNPTTEDGCSSEPVIAEEEVGQVVEGGGEDDEECWWHDQSKLVHW